MLPYTQCSFTDIDLTCEISDRERDAIKFSKKQTKSDVELSEFFDISPRALDGEDMEFILRPLFLHVFALYALELDGVNKEVIPVIRAKIRALKFAIHEVAGRFFVNE